MKNFFTIVLSLFTCIFVASFAALPPGAHPIGFEADPEDSLANMVSHRIIYTHFTAQNYAQDYKPWLSQSLDTLVKSNWSAANMKYNDVTLHFTTRSKVGSVLLFDHQGIFTTNPARIFLKKDSTLTEIGLFEGRRYLVFDTLKLQDSLEADALVIRKYGNNLPQKAWVYGREMQTMVDPIVSVPTAPVLKKIPIDPDRLIILNYAPGKLDALFDGKLDVNPITGYGDFMPDYEAWYPLNDGEEIDLRQIKMYDYTGVFTDNPLKIYVADSTGTRTPIGSFTGSRFQEWVGPYPQKDPYAPGVFLLDTPKTTFRYIIFEIHKNQLPSEIEFWGNYQAPDSTKILPHRPTSPLANAAGVNGFEWDFVVPSSTTSRIINPGKYAPIKAFTGFRHYLDWQRIENTEGSYSFNPAHWGGWSYDMTYKQCFEDGIEVLVCMQNVPPWMRNTYPAGEQSTDNSPLKYGLDRMVAASYIEKARAGFQIAARYGRNPLVDPSLIKVNTQSRWPNDPPNEVKAGLGWVKYIECDNEANKWWRGRKGYLNAFEYAANLSAFYDGHKQTLGAGVGVKNADTTMQVVMMGMAAADPSYVRGMIEWCRINRGYKPDGNVDICWDVINYHHYSNDKNSDQTGQATRGFAPDLSISENLAKNFMEFSRMYASNMPVWLTEVGYDLHQESPMKAIPIGNKSPLLTQADWNLRTALIYMRAGIDRIFFYELNDNAPFSSTKYNSMGLVDSLFQLRPAGNYLLQMRNLMGNFRFNKSLSADPSVDEYIQGTQKAYALWIPDETGRTANYTLPVGENMGVMVYVPQPNSSEMHSYWINATDDSVALPVTETPIFVIPQMELPNFTSKVYKRNH